MIYPQSVQGKFRNIKTLTSLALLLIYFFGSWIRWSRPGDLPNQAIYMSLGERRGYLFNIEIWPEELYLLAGLLVLAALGLFLVTNLYGRIWCGYACPHTVFVEIFVKIEAFFQGDRNARIKLDAQPMTFSKFTKKLYTHLAWALVGFGCAFGWVCYFYDTFALIKDLLRFQVTLPATCWLVGLTLSTYCFAGFIRELVCLYMCPYGRFQSAMLDNSTTLITYHENRGEPRGKLTSKPNLNGDCIDCNKCVVVCPMGVDIRNGLQLGCINCGLCVDACNSVMEKIGRPLDLIGYDSVSSQTEGTNPPKKLANKKALIFLLLFISIGMVIFYQLVNKDTLRVTILHDRNALYTWLPDGSLRNTYTLKIFNKTNQVQTYVVTATGIEGAKIKFQGFDQNYGASNQIDVDFNQEIELIVFVQASKEALKSGPNAINFQLNDSKTNRIYTTSSTFVSE